MEKKDGKKKGGKKRQAPSTVFVNVSNTRFSVVKHSVEEMGYKITESTSKNLLFWCDSGGSFEFTSQLSHWQFYNHFPGTWAIARKVDLSRNIEKMSRLLPEFYDFHPKSFIIPSQFTEMEQFMNSISKKSKKTFIVKPDRGSFGKGIVLIQSPDSIQDWIDSAIAQQYIEPYLIDGLKFDLRIYALVSSIEPLRIYLFHEGIGRFCTEPYSKPKSKNLELSFAHLTNYALNKNNPNFRQPTDAEHADSGHKRSLTSVLEYMKANGVDVDDLMSQIEDIIRLTVISIQPYLSTNYRTAIPLNDGKSRCFEVLGFDILIDKYHKPWLLEVNWSPSLATESPFDKALKTDLIQGALKIINIPPNFKQKVNRRRKAISQKRTIGQAPNGIINLWDPDEETEISKTTHWQLIYPLSKSHPKYSKTEIAFAESKASPVGASVQPAAARIRKEAMLAQLREEIPNLNTKYLGITNSNSNTNSSSNSNNNTNTNTNANSNSNSNNNTNLNKNMNSNAPKKLQISKPISHRQQVNNKASLVARSQVKRTPNVVLVQSQQTLVPIHCNKTFQGIPGVNQSSVSKSNTFANTGSFPIHMGNSPKLNLIMVKAPSLFILENCYFIPSRISEDEEKKRKELLKRQMLLAQTLNIPAFCYSLVQASKEIPVHPPNQPSIKNRQKSLVKQSTNQSIFKPMIIVQRQPVFC
ncbi:Tubulin polyglutamylase TTLL7 [Tritrichomonas foetus]|uniref:Tubulin polyglutamylase TTLL7 n=1 Tax=Tritrichomonas foetus TaxID=1144522 RepID=A0A1J4K402_9EUKA|nr:Tubulin polyglutamylase TTLL7 [Tritrichomonas foetus]|eukprot:OHT06177.1 Tubulin polyglutamylase TTLL7 [Tritrichomonas foetus]